MQSVASGWTAEERDSTRKIVASTQVSWKKTFNSTIRSFTIGVSSIGGVDVIASGGAVVSDWNRYIYSDESNYLTGLSYERMLQQPIGGVSVAQANWQFDNTSGRFTPRYMGGTNVETYTAVQKIQRPVIINSGFCYDGIDQSISQFVGVTSKTPEVSIRDRSAKYQANDFLGYLQNRYVDRDTMWTGLRTDQVLENILTDLGYSTAQYSLDMGLQTIPFGIFEAGTRYIDIVNELSQAENAHFYQDEAGILRFENRQHWDNAPYTQVQRIINTAQVIEAKSPTDSHLINVVEVVSKPRKKLASTTVFTQSGVKEINPSSSLEIWVNFDDPMLSINTPSYTANTLSDGTGTDITSSVNLTTFDKFARSAKIVLTNTTTSVAYITSMTISGRSAPLTGETLYTRLQDDSSVTAYEERPYRIENDYIQSQSWADSFAQLILNDYSDIEALQELTIRAIPELQFGDLISWQGRDWRVYGIKSTISPSAGFIQTLKILQNNRVRYFRIGVSTIGSSDQIAP